jgi:hypothetical protein
LDPASFAVGVITGVIGILLLTVGLKILAPWLRLKMRGGKGSLVYVLAIHLRGNSPTLLIDAYTSLLHAGKETSLREIEIFYVAHGHKVSTSAELISLIHQSEDSKLSS